MRLLLGGTRFLGRHLAAQALARGHAVTLLHRGLSDRALFPEAEHLIADRNGDLAVLDGRTWDAAIDTSAYVPRQVRSVAAKLAGRVGSYQLVSSISVYAAHDRAGQDETAPRATLADPAAEAVDGTTYGGLKALCEDAARAAFGGAALVSRPGLIVGPNDPTGRFTWWVTRLARGGAVLAPGDPATPVQFIDVRDLAAWHLAQAEAGGAGTFNLTGPLQPLTMGRFIDTAAAVLGPATDPPRPVCVDEGWLLAQGVKPWSDLPVWLPRAQAALHQTSIARAVAAGLRCRALEQTLRDTAAWAAQDAHGGAPAPLPEGPPRPPVGLAPEREAALLAAWARR